MQDTPFGVKLDTVAAELEKKISELEAQLELWKSDPQRVADLNRALQTVKGMHAFTTNACGSSEYYPYKG